MRTEKRKWKIRESLKFWKFIFREVVASHLFFPHFFDWWSWRFSFAWIFVTNMAGGKHHRWRRGYWKYWFVWPVIWVNFDFTTLMHVTLTQGPSSFIQSILSGSHCVSSHCGPIFSLWQFQSTPGAQNMIHAVVDWDHRSHCNTYGNMKKLDMYIRTTWSVCLKIWTWMRFINELDAEF